MCLKSRRSPDVMSLSRFVILFVLIALAFLCPEFCSLGATPPSTVPLCVKCSEEPSCVVVGDTHLLEWKSLQSRKIVVVCIHGLGLCAKAYKPLGHELSAVGIDGFAVNVRGFGPDREQVERAKLDCEKTVEDVRVLLSILRKERPDWRIVVVGESMGGALAIRVASEYPQLLDGVICSAPAWKLQEIKKTAVRGVLELTFFRKSRPGPAGSSVMKQATSDSQLSGHWIADRSHKLKLSFEEARRFLKFISKTEEHARRLEKPVLILQGLNDHLVSPKAVSKIYRGIPSSHKALLIDCSGEHLLLEEGQYKQALLDELVKWITAPDLEQNRTGVSTLLSEPLSKKEKRRLRKLEKISGG